MGHLSVIRWNSVSALFSINCRQKYCKTFFRSFVTRVKYNMGTAYFQQQENKVLINICLNHESIKKTLSFERNIDENISVFMNRFDDKLSSVFSRKASKANKKSKITEELPKIRGSFLLNNEPVPDDIKFIDFFQGNFDGKLKFNILDGDYKVILNAPLVKKLTLPELLQVGSFIMPECFEAEYTDLESSQFIWYRSKFPQKEKFWEKCGEGYFYIPKEEDTDLFLKLECIPIKDEKEGPVISVVSQNPVGQYISLEEIKKRHEYTAEQTESNEIRVVSYNILADTYTSTKEAKTELFVFCDPKFLNFDYRRCMLNAELTGYNADIICLQEVDVKFYKVQKQLFSHLGYSCFFHEKEGSREGCLLLYNMNKFKVLGVNQYIFAKELLTNPLFRTINENIRKNEKLYERLQSIATQIQVVVLECLSNQVLVVGNTHFYFHPDADHIRLLQGILSWKILMDTVEKIKSQNLEKKVSIILCGDLNSTPECGFHEFLATGKIESDHFAWKNKEDEEIPGITCHHSVNMKSAYDNNQFTNYTPLFKGCLDYIYYQTDHLKLKQVVPIPSDEVLSRCQGIPSQFFPSDHVALISDFQLKE